MLTLELSSQLLKILENAHMLLSQTLIGCSLLTAQPRVLQAQWLLPVTVNEDNFTFVVPLLQKY